MTRDQDYTRDRLVECRGPATVDDGDEVTFVYQRPDGSQYDRKMVFRLLDAGQPNHSETSQSMTARFCGDFELACRNGVAGINYGAYARLRSEI